MLETEPLIVDTITTESGEQFAIKVFLSDGMAGDNYYLVEKYALGDDEPTETYFLQNAGEGQWIERDLGETAIASEYGRFIDAHSY